MVVFGLLSLLQIIFLPGYLLLKALRAGTGILATCVLAFALSLLANHVLVAGLVVFHFYRPAVVYAIFALELALLATTERGLLTMPLAEAAAIFRRRRGTSSHRSTTAIHRSPRSCTAHCLPPR